MVAGIDWPTNIVRGNPDTNVNTNAFAFMQNVQSQLLDDQQKDDVYNQLMQKETDVLKTLNSVSNAVLHTQRMDPSNTNIMVWMLFSNVIRAIIVSLQLIVRMDLKTLAGMIYSDAIFRMHLGIAFVLLSTGVWLAG